MVQKQNSNAFIGVSLDNQIFLTDWLTLALKKIINSHDTILFLLADDLLRYTRTVIDVNGIEQLDFIEIENIILKRKSKFTQHLETTLLNFTKEEKKKIIVKNWNNFEDNKYNSILRNLIIAFYNLKSFREDVYSLAHQHLKKFSNSSKYDNLLNSSALYIIDEVSMAIRVSEFDNFHNEYYPTEEISILTNLYNNKYQANGLTVEVLINQQPKRKFKTLNILTK